MCVYVFCTPATVHARSDQQLPAFLTSLSKSCVNTEVLVVKMHRDVVIAEVLLKMYSDVVIEDQTESQTSPTFVCLVSQPPTQP